MAPLTRVIVHYVRKDGEVVADGLNFFVDRIVPYIEVQVTPNSVESGKDVDIIVKSDPNSYVGVLGVDESVLGEGGLTLVKYHVLLMIRL